MMLQVFLLATSASNHNLINKIGHPFVHDIPVRKVHLRAIDPSSSFVYVPQPGQINSDSNFLASQVWPSSRAAASVISKTLHMFEDEINTICELGCGPGLPSITAAHVFGKSKKRVIATDIDQFALDLVSRSAQDQNLINVKTEIFDLTSDYLLPEADLYLLSDVFEYHDVAVGSARHTYNAIKKGKRVWTFSQSDRVQREVYLCELRRLFDNKDIMWSNSTPENFENISDRLLLYDVDELKVHY